MDFIYIRYFDSQVDPTDDGFVANLAGWKQDFYGAGGDGEVHTMGLGKRVYWPSSSTQRIPMPPPGSNITVHILPPFINATDVPGKPPIINMTEGYLHPTGSEGSLPTISPFFPVTEPTPPASMPLPIPTDVSTPVEELPPVVTTLPDFPPFSDKPSGTKLFIGVAIDAAMRPDLLPADGTTKWSSYRPPYLDAIRNTVAAAELGDTLGGAMLWGAVGDVVRADTDGVTFAQVAKGQLGTLGEI
ncbi:hypothetical protein K402DRAFT_391673 [Aulographum hederae CBS 113979]|uniref:Uncharacterized protein n=1 Tax=Aulographum hederae CBS 113979 TaxID=1176131 RepID=A0A6G1H5V6_9PEZI|nr:hypothetical protein K402DRAFT_391673 [Aulographum hederae CBS 113979]